jgi:hypothetical protein
MPIKGGDLIHVGNQVLLDRAQTAGPGQVNIPSDKIYELGNYQSVGTVFDIPDLSFPVESFDASAEMESMIVGKDFATDADGTEYDLNKNLPVDIVSQFKTGKPPTNPFDVAVGVNVPALSLESVSYRFGLSDNASQTDDPEGRLDLLHPRLGLRPGGDRHQHRQPDDRPGPRRLPLQG